MNAFSTRPTPILKGKVAENFLREAEAAQKKQCIVAVATQQKSNLSGS